MHTHKSKTTIMFVALLLGLGLTSVCFAQSGDLSKGSMSVEVVDSSKSYVPNASVTISGPTGEIKLTTSEHGSAVFFNLIPGTYTAKVTATGFRTAEVTGLAVSANNRTFVNVPLQVGAVAETIVTVTGETAQIDPTTTTTGSILTQDTYSNIPIARNVSALFSLAPGAAPAGDSVLAGNPSLSGSTGLENQYIIDGISTTDAGYGAFGVFSIQYGSIGTGVNTDFVKEVQIKTGGFEAQYGAAMGGIVNIVTDSGGNKMHGSAYAYSAPDFAEGVYKQPNDYPRIGSPQNETIGRHSWDVGFNVGGPFIQNRFFWYGSFNPSLTDRIRQGPVNYATRALGPQDWNQRSYNWVGKLTFDLANAHRLEASAFGDPSRWPMEEHRDLIRDDLDNKTSAYFGTRNWAVKYHGGLSPTTLLDVSFSWNHSYFEESPEHNTFMIRDYGKPKPTGTYTIAGGPGYMGNDQADSKQFQWMLTRNAKVLGTHQFDIGYAYNPVNYDAMRYYTGTVWPLPNSPGIAAGDVGKPVYGGYFYLYPTRTIAGKSYTNVYRQSRGNFGSPLFATTTNYQNAFIQDAWQINRYLTAKVGVRWEQQHIVGMVNDYVFAANWAPRLGFIIDPTGSRKTKLFANWGRFFEKIPQDIATRSMSAEQSYYLQYTSALPPTADNLIPGSVYSPYATDATVWAGGTKSMYQQEIVAGFERELPAGLVFSARFIWRDVKRILEDIAGITAEQALAGASQQFVLSNPSASLDYFHNAVLCATCETGYTDDSGMIGADGKPDGFPDPRRVYKALEITLDKRMSNNWSLTANYRLAKLFGNYEGLFRNDNGQSDPNITSQFDFAYSPLMGDQFKVGLLPTDRRHMVNLYGNYLWRKINIGLGWQAMTGAPLSKFLSHPVYLNAGEIPVGGRGTFGKTPFENYFDMKVEYQLPFSTDKYRVKASADIFNLFDRKTTTSIDQNFELSGAVPNADFMKPLAYHRPTYARFALRFEF
jgi:hypothetical protein